MTGPAPAPSGPTAGRRVHWLIAALCLLLAGCAQGPSSAAPSVSAPSIGRWGLNPQAMPSAEGRSVSVGVWEVPCSSGRDISGKILPPDISYEPSRVTVTIWLEALPALGPDEAFECPLVGPFPYTIELSEPLGDRQLVDGNQASGGNGMVFDLVDPHLMGQWQLVSGEVDGQEFVPFPGAPVTFWINGQGASGSGGCNRYHAESMTIGEHEMTFAGHGQTPIGCPDGRGGVEVLFLRGLDHVTSWELVVGSLVLTGTNVRLELHRPPAS